MNTHTWHVEKLVPVLLSGGFFAHLINVARYYQFGESDIGEILLWPVDFTLALIMTYCAVALIVRHKAMAAGFKLDSAARRIGYWIITGYITASVPGHLIFLTSGNTAYFDFFPWWFSLIIMPTYVLMLAYFITLVPRPGGTRGLVERGS